MVNGGFNFVDLQRLEALSLPSLTSGSVTARGAGALAGVSVPRLATGLVRVDGSTSLTSLSLPMLATGEVFVSGTTGLTSLSAPVLTEVNNLTLDWNTSLAALSLPSLRTVTYRLMITYNSSLPECLAEAIAAQVTDPPGSAIVYGNDASATCPPLVEPRSERPATPGKSPGTARFPRQRPAPDPWDWTCQHRRRSIGPRRVTMAVSWLEHRGHRILYVDYRNLGAAGCIATLHEHFAALEAVTEPVLTLVDARGAGFSAEFIREAKAAAPRNTARTLRRAIVGVEGVKELMLPFFNTGAAPVPMKPFATFEEALAYLIAP